MTRFLLLRHGETEWNRELVFRGRKDIPLSEHGREQARRLAEALREEPIDALYCSPLARAQETAEALNAGRELTLQLREELLDMDFGEWEGLAVSEVEARYPEEFARWRDHPAEALPPGGEGLRDIRARAAALLGELCARHQEATVAIVTHRVVCKLLVCEVLGLANSAFWRIQQDVCALNIFSAAAGKFVLLRMNDTCHLRSEAAGVDF